MRAKPSRGSSGVLLELGSNERGIPSFVSGTGPTHSPVFTIQRILIPIDFSPCSTKALQYAIPLANQFGARLYLLYVGQGYYPIPALGPVDVTSAEAHARADAAGRLAELATQEIAEEVPVDILVRTGWAPQEIIRAAREFRADVIVISTHGYTGLKHGWFGSVTENVVRHAPCPVLVVREQEHEFLCGISAGQRQSVSAKPPGT